MERMGLAEDKENDSTVSTNQTVDNKMDCQDTLQDKEHKGSKPSKKKRK